MRCAIMLTLAIGSSIALAEAIAVAAGSSIERTTALAWAALVGGPAFLFLLHARVAARGSIPWKIAAAWTIVSSIGGAAAELTKLVLANEGQPGAMGAIALYMALTVLCALAGAYALSRTDRPTRVWTLRLSPLALLGALPMGENLLTLSLIVVEAVACLSLLGFARAWSAWGKATVLASLVAVGGLVAMRVAHGGSLVMRGNEGASVLGPLFLAAAAVFVAVLLRSKGAADLRGTTG